MFRIIKNKKGQATTGILGGRKKEKDDFDENKLIRGAFAVDLTKRVMDGIGKRMAGRDKTISLSHFLKIGLMPAAWFLRIIQNNAARVLQIAIIFMIAGSIWMFGVPTITVLAAENDLRTLGDWGGYIKEDIVGWSGILKSMEKTRDQFEYKLYGQFAEPEKNEKDDKKYGIYMTSRDIGPLKELYAPNEQIIIYAYPKAEVLSGSGNAQIECMLEESMGPAIIYPGHTIALSSLPGSSITCVFDPIAVNDDPQREATITIKYPFATSSTLPVSVMSKSEYDALFKLMMIDEGMDVISAKKEIAKSVKVDFNERATINENTPVVIGAEITEYQPLVKNAGYTASLLVTVTNQGEGTIQEITSMKISAGDLGLKLNGIGIDINPYGIVDPEYLHSIGEINNFQSFLFGVETSSFQLDPNKDVTTSRINVYVDYIYNISAKTDVNVASCRTFPEACGEEMADVEENDEGEI